MSIAIPEGYELHAGRGRENAKAALAIAEERGFPAASVLTHPEGYLVRTVDEESETNAGEVGAIETVPGAESESPVEPEPVELPKPSASKAEQEAFAAEHGIDLSETTNTETRAAAIQAWADAQPDASAEAVETEEEN